MKITDVKVTVWEWNDIPPTRYTLNVKSSGTRSTHMALVKIITDEGIEGHAFLGNALSSLGNDANVIIDRFKPMLVGQDPLAREKNIPTYVYLGNGSDLESHWRHRRRALGSCWQSSWRPHSQIDGIIP